MSYCMLYIKPYILQYETTLQPIPLKHFLLNFGCLNWIQNMKQAHLLKVSDMLDFFLGSHGKNKHHVKHPLKFRSEECVVCTLC